jgi:hypothetical protein
LVVKILRGGPVIVVALVFVFGHRAWAKNQEFRFEKADAQGVGLAGDISLTSTKPYAGSPPKRTRARRGVLNLSAINFSKRNRSRLSGAIAGSSKFQHPSSSPAMAGSNLQSLP